MKRGLSVPDAGTITGTAALRLCICAVGTLPGYSVISSGTVRIQTATGSVYDIDLDAGIWHRVPTLGSGRLRGERGTILAFHHAGLGRSAVLECPPLVVDSERRVVVTSALVAIDWGDDRRWLRADDVAGTTTLGEAASLGSGDDRTERPAPQTTGVGSAWE